MCEKSVCILHHRAMQADVYIIKFLMLQWRQTKVETTGATLIYKTLISRLFETFLDFETKKQVVPRHAGTP